MPLQKSLACPFANCALGAEAPEPLTPTATPYADRSVDGREPEQPMDVGERCRESTVGRRLTLTPSLL